RASKLGDKLIVGVSTDDFCHEKGKTTVFDINKRMEMVSDLRYVSLVIPEYNMAQKVNDIEKYGVDVFVLGSDYSESFLKMPEYELLKNKCDIVFLPRTEGISTTILKQEHNFL
ncbi:MAG: adenylyltransferase/cytidyltransferase family protein, partial [Acutalibacteraceae bacterium]